MSSTPTQLLVISPSYSSELGFRRAECSMIYGFGADADPSQNRIQATPSMTEDSLLLFSFPAVDRKKITAAFDGGRITSDAGVVLLGQAERRRGLADQFAPHPAHRRILVDARSA